MKTDMPWQSHGPTFNSWWDDFKTLTDALNEMQPHPWWMQDMELKYLNIRIDTRDNGFILTDRDGKQIEPTRVLNAINAFKARWPKTFNKP